MYIRLGLSFPSVLSVSFQQEPFSLPVLKSCDRIFSDFWGQTASLRLTALVMSLISARGYYIDI